MRPVRLISVAAAVMLFALALLDQKSSVGAVFLMIAVSVIAVLDNGLEATAITEFAGPTWSGRSLGVQNTAQRLMAAVSDPDLRGADRGVSISAGVGPVRVICLARNTVGADSRAPGSETVIRQIEAAQLPIAIPDKPRLRGWIHVYCAAAALVAGSALVTVSWAVASRLAGHATLAYALAIVSMFGVSGTYHRVHWGSDVTSDARMRRLDHSMIYIFYRRHLHTVRKTGHASTHRACGLGHCLGRSAGRRCADALLASGPTLAERDSLPAAGLGGGLVHRTDPPQRRRRRHSAAWGGWCSLQSRRDRLRAPPARPLAEHIRIPRGIPCLYRGSSDMPLCCGVLGRVLASWYRERLLSSLDEHPWR